MDKRLIILYVLMLLFRTNAARRRTQMLKSIESARARRLSFFRRLQAHQRYIFSVVLCLLAVRSSGTVQRSLWTHERTGEWWERIVNQCFDRRDWLENFRMSQDTFMYLCEKLKPAIEKQDTVLRKAIPVQQRVAIALWKLATNSEYRSIAHLFGVSRSSVCLIVKDVCEAIVKLLQGTYISVPSGDRLKFIVDGFETKWGFPQCVGAIDGSHIPIVSPQDHPADYYNRKGWHSIILQAVVDHELRFWNINVGWPGRVHDARVFGNSALFQKAQSGTLLPSMPRTLNGVDVPLVILGDPAYPLLPWLMKPYVQHGNITSQQKAFNYRLSRARMVIENAFGRLKGRWRCLLKRNDISTEDIPTVITACCVLHNICEVHRDEFNEEWLEGCTESPLSSATLFQSTSASGNITAESIRSAIRNYIIVP